MAGNFVVGQASKIVMYARRTTPNPEKVIKGLNKMTLPIGWTSSFTSISEFGTPIDIQVASGLKYDTVSVAGNFTVKDPTQAAIRKLSLNATPIKDMRFYLDPCNFVALDLASNPDGYYQIGSCNAPGADKSGVYSFGFDISPAGPSTLFENHSPSGTSPNNSTITTIAMAAGIVTITGTKFQTAGFLAGQTLIIDKLTPTGDPIYLKINTVLTELSIVCVVDLTATSGMAASTNFTGEMMIHSGAAMSFDNTTVVC